MFANFLNAIKPQTLNTTNFWIMKNGCCTVTLYNAQQYCHIVYLDCALVYYSRNSGLINFIFAGFVQLVGLKVVLKLSRFGGICDDVGIEKYFHSVGNPYPTVSSKSTS